MTGPPPDEGRDVDAWHLSSILPGAQTNKRDTLIAVFLIATIMYNLCCFSGADKANTIVSAALLATQWRRPAMGTTAQDRYHNNGYVGTRTIMKAVAQCWSGATAMEEHRAVTFSLLQPRIAIEMMLRYNELVKEDHKDAAA